MVLVGVVLGGLWWADIGPFGRLPWWVIALPFVAAVLWWQFSDSTGLTQKRAIDKMERRKADRREKAMEALGLDGRRERLATRSRKDAARRSFSATVDPTQQEGGAAPPPVEPRRGPRL
jgi:small Trp-rich protein